MNMNYSGNLKLDGEHGFESGSVKLIQENSKKLVDEKRKVIKELSKNKFMIQSDQNFLASKTMTGNKWAGWTAGAKELAQTQYQEGKEKGE